jgi:NADH:ubiquinone oxidoreductase subunit F (NADH-binding)/NAD-dependent dihydropyrimidine dehydrogenase PreA subunit
MTTVRILDDLNNIKNQGLRRLYPQNIRVTVGMATCGLATGANVVFNSLCEAEKNFDKRLSVMPVGCIGFCQREPIVDILMPGLPRITFSNVDEDKAKKILEYINGNRGDSGLAAWRCDEDEFLITKERKKLCNGTMPDDIKSIILYKDVPFFKKQLKIVLRNCGYINPEDIVEYIGRGGYHSLYKVLTEMKPEEVIEEVKKSGLRGRGGAGFPTGIKWEICRNVKGNSKYIICNADEGDPGAYMDRSILEGDPHSVIEGMLIGAYAIGATAGHIYVRTEYPLAIERFTKAIKDAEAYGFLGEDILGKGFNFKINISQGAGAFVCGEETSLIASIEGRPPEPRLRPPFPAESGLWEKPTNINNVETWANVPVIIGRGGDWFAQIGTEKSKGTKVFSLVGKIENTGLIEVPMGIRLEEILEIGGGILQGKEFKAIQTGGPSGGCIPHQLTNLPVDYEKLIEAGSIMGSGGMIVMDENTCMVDVAKYFLDFLKDESCGKCTSCRDGLRQMYEIVKRITEGRGNENDVELLENLGTVVQAASMCGLGQTAANPVLSTIKYFRDEYTTHIKELRCPALVCKALISYSIDPQLCGGCTVCVKNCPSSAIIGEPKKVHTIDQSKCIKCGICITICPPKFTAVKIVSPVPLQLNEGKK